MSFPHDSATTASVPPAHNSKPLTMERAAGTLSVNRSLASLTPEELDHVSLGLTHAFGATLSGRPGDTTFFLHTEGGDRLPIARWRTLSELWSTATAATDDD